MAHKYIIVTGSDGGYGNLGDEFIADASKGYYEKYQTKFRIIILRQLLPQKNTENMKGKFIYCIDNQKEFEKLKIPIKDIVLVHYYGGGYLNDYWYEDKMWLHGYLISKGLGADKFVFTGEGLGPLSEKTAQKLQTVASNSLLFGVRDRFSMSLIENTQFSFDDTVSLINPTRYNFKRKNIIALNLRPHSDHVEVSEDYLIRLLQTTENYAQENNLKLIIFSMVKNEFYDEEWKQRELIAKSRIKNYELVARPQDYRRLLLLVEQVRLVITTSYHATLAALYTKTPVLSIYQNEYYRLKFEGLSDTFSSPLLNQKEVSKFSKSDINKAIKTRSLLNVLRTILLTRKLKKSSDNCFAVIGNRLIGEQDA